MRSATLERPGSARMRVERGDRDASSRRAKPPSADGASCLAPTGGAHYEILAP